MLDVRDVSNVHIVGVLDTLGIARNTAVFGGYVLVADGPQGVKIVNTSKPDKLIMVAQAYPMANVYDIVVIGSTAYVAGGGSGRPGLRQGLSRRGSVAGLSGAHGEYPRTEALSGARAAFRCGTVVACLKRKWGGLQWWRSDRLASRMPALCWSFC